ncbi:MAG: hypothetical protein ABIU55_09430 [Ferruginibacter sp.]
MKKQKLILLLIAMSLSTAGFTQLGSLMKKKKDKEQKEAVKSDSAPAATEETATEATNNSTSSDKTEGDVDEGLMKDNKVAWKNNFESTIDWFSLSPVGNLIVSANKALYGVDGVTGKIIWKNEKFGGVDQENFAMIANSPYIAMVSGGLLNRQQTILNALDGKVVADTRQMGYKMVGKRYPVPNQDGFLLTAYENNKQTIFFINAPSATEAWKLQDIFNKNSEVVNTRPLSVSSDEFLIATDKNIYKLNTTKGSVVYSIPFKTPNEKLLTENVEDEGITESTKAGEEPKDNLKSAGKVGGIASRMPGPLGKLGGAVKTASDVKSMTKTFGSMKGAANLASTETSGKFFKIDDSERVYYFNNKYFVIIDEKNGKLLSEPFKFDDNLASFIPDTKGFVFATDEKKSELYYIDAITGKNRWAKSVELKGKITNMSLNEGKIAVSSAKQKGNNYVNIIDVVTGEEVNKKDMKVRGTVSNLVMTKRGLIYSTDDETNIQDPVSGKNVIGKALRYKTGGSNVRKDGKYYVINDNEISVLDETSGEVSTFAKVNFKDKEDPQQLELLSEGILVSSAQNMVLLGWDGKEKYHTFYKAPGVSTAGKIMGGLTMAVAVTQSAAHGYAAGQSGFGTSAYNSHMDQADRWSNFGAAGASQFSKRFNMTSGSKNYQVILTKVDDGEDKGFGLVKVNKLTGQTEGKVVIGDKKPDYLFDDVNGVIYYKDKNRKITAYRL